MRTFLLYIVLINITQAYSQDISLRVNNNKSDIFEKEVEYNYALTEATKQKLFGNLKEATSLYKSCINSVDYKAVPYYELAGIYSLVGNYQEALIFAKIAVKIEPKNLWYTFLLSDVYCKCNKIDSAVRLIQSAIRIEPDFRLKFKLAELLLLEKKFKSALTIVLNIESAIGQTNQSLLLKESIYQKSHNFNMAENTAIELIQRNQDDIRFLGLIAELYDTYGRKDLADKYFHKILDLDPSSELGNLSYLNFLRLNQKKAQYFISGRSFINNPDFDKKLKISFIKDGISDEKLMNSNCDSLLSFLNCYSKFDSSSFEYTGLSYDFNIRCYKFKEALKYLIKIGDFGVEKIDYFFQLFELNRILGNYNYIIDTYERLPSTIKNNSRLKYYYGISLYESKKDSEAIAFYLKFVEEVKNDKSMLLQCYSILGEIYNSVQQFSESDVYYEKALILKENDLVILNNYSYFLARRNTNLEKAYKLSRKTIKKEPCNPTYLDTYGYILLRLKKTRKAEVILQKAINCSVDQDPVIFDHLGEALYLNGKTSEADSIWKIAFPGKDLQNILNEKEFE